MSKHYESIQNVPREERDNIYQSIRKDIAPIVARHGESIVRWALNKYNTEERRKTALRSKIAEAKEELGGLES